MNNHPCCQLWVVCVVLLACLPQAGAFAQPGAADLVGTWVMQAEGFEMILQLEQSGAFSRQTVTEGVRANIQGTWKVNAQQIAFEAQGEGTRVFRFQLADANTLALLAEDNTGFELIRAQGLVGDNANAQGAGLNAPVPEEIATLARNLVAPPADPMARPPGLKVPGWKTVYVNTGWFMYPPTWAVEQSESRYGAHAWDARAKTHLWFAALDVLQGNPAPEQMAALIVQRQAGDVPVRVLNSAVRPSLIALNADDGQEYLWTGRWIDAEGTKIFFRLSVLVLARSPIGTQTSTIWGMQACPEAVAVRTWKETFSVIEKTQVFPPPGGDRVRPDRDGDGIADDDDPAPDDPNVR